MNVKRWLSALLALVMVLSLAACGGKAEEPTAPVVGEVISYSVTVKSMGGMPLEGVDVYVYADQAQQDMKGFAETNAEGKAEFKLPQMEGYVIVLSSAPKGYQLDQTAYTFTGNTAQIQLKSGLITGENLSGASLGLGDVMYDFSVVAADGSTVALSEMLAEKEMVLINFFYTTCGPCVNEFPFLQEAYTMYQDKVGVIALDPLDDINTVAAFQSSMGLTFPMAACQATWSQTFGVTGYPTSVVVDRYGVICLVETGSLPSLRPFTSIFEHFTGDDYEQILCVNGVDDVITVMKPNVEMPASEDIAATIHGSEIPVTYRAEAGESAELTWPFVIGEKNGEACIQSSNKNIESSYAIIYADVELKAGEAVGFDYMISSELGSDAFVVIVDGEDIFQMSGYNEEETWETCYPWVADADGTYEVALCYLKDESDNAGDDTVYIKNMRIVSQEEIDTPTYLPRQVASTEDGFVFSYVETVLNEKDGYYHVGSENGPLLLANLMGYTQFNEERTAWEYLYEGDVILDGINYYEDAALVDYFNFASNSNLTGICPVTAELAEYLKIFDQTVGFDDEDTQEWLRMCMYYEQYGTDVPMENPVAGLAPFSAYTAKEGKNVETNYFYYNRIIIPRGLLAEFIPSRSGVYRITSRSDSTNGVDGWIFNEDRQELLVYEMDERMFNDNTEVSMVFYMEAGKPYYIDIAFWDPYEVGYIYYDIEYLSSTRQHFRLCAPSYFTYDSDATGDAMYHLVNGGIDVVLGDDGYYYEDLGDGKKGSKIYCDFSGITSLFSNPIASVQAYNEDGSAQVDAEGNPVMVKGMIDMGGFDFSKTEDDLYILGIMEAQGNDVDKTVEYLKAYWGADYDAYAEAYQLEDVLEGKFHGTGDDLTEEMKGYLKKMISTGAQELRGCVPVDARLAEILQLLMGKYTFENVDNSWIKLCYYYDYLGPSK